MRYGFDLEFSMEYAFTPAPLAIISPQNQFL